MGRTILLGLSLIVIAICLLLPLCLHMRSIQQAAAPTKMQESAAVNAEAPSHSGSSRLNSRDARNLFGDQARELRLDEDDGTSKHRDLADVPRASTAESVFSTQSEIHLE